MSSFQIQTERRPDFVYKGTTYSLAHLDEYVVSAQDQTGEHRSIVVTFEDHCFTREWRPDDPRELVYPGCSRNPGSFCVDRYACSLRIREHIATATRGSVWLLKGHNIAIIPQVELDGAIVDYGIVFNLDRISGIEGIPLHMRVKTAYPFTEKRPTTYGKTRFRVLIDLRMRNKHPSLNTSQHRRW